MQLSFRRFDCQLARPWTIASRTGDGPGTRISPVVLLELRDADGVVGLGEAAPSNRYREDMATVQAFLSRVDAARLSFADVPGSMACLDALAPGDFAAKCALNVALLDGAGRRAGRFIHDLLGVGFTEGRHHSSFSIGIDVPDIIRQKVLEAARFPRLKLKLGSHSDRENLAALRAAAPDKPVRVDANEAWKTKEEAQRQLEWLAGDGHIEFVEQPMPAATPAADWRWLKERSPLPLMADESYKTAADLPAVAGCFHAVNVKLVKCGGISAGLGALRAARAAGLKTMLGCMIETSVLITAAAHLAELTDYLDLDGALLTKNDPFRGAVGDDGRVSFAACPARAGLAVASR